jgi:hypothetical protein
MRVIPSCSRFANEHMKGFYVVRKESNERTGGGATIFIKKLKYSH